MPSAQTISHAVRLIYRLKVRRQAASQSTRKAMTMPTNRKALALIVALTASIAAAHADDYPSHPIRLVVPYTPGGGADSVARIVAKPVSQTIGLPVNTLKEFVALVKSKPGELNYGTTGVGSANHLVTELFSSKAGLNTVHIPYRGTALAVADLLAAQVTMVFADPISALGQMQAGALRSLAVNGNQYIAVASGPCCVRPSGDRLDS
jgi:tripartite-type tricarboxylate transporter receptor subunit TctC